MSTLANTLDTTAGGLTSTPRNPFVRLVREERWFIALIATGFLAVGAVYQNAFLARWLGFALAAYSAVANDSIQTIGTFIAANRGVRWWKLWLFIGGIFLATVLYGYWAYGGDVTYGRLATKGFHETPTSFSFLQVAAPLFLMVLTRLRMPVSTTFLLLSCFATEAGGIEKVLLKSLSGYAIAFLGAIAVWYAISNVMARLEKAGAPHPGWLWFQWLSSGLLWSVWIMQDAANIAVYLPRQLGLVELAVFSLTVFFGLGVLFKIGGERVQEVVDEKSSVTDVRSASLINFVYAIILFVFQFMSSVPMSTTWVFIGLLGGRELAMCMKRASGRPFGEAVRLMGRDVLYAPIGLLVSILLALAVNDEIRQHWFG